MGKNKFFPDQKKIFFTSKTLYYFEQPMLILF